MQHIVNIAFDFDDEKVKSSIEKNVEKQVVDKITKDVEGKLFEKAYWTNMRGYSLSEAPLSRWTENIIRDIFLEHKDEIIEKAAYILADSFKRTKAWKEAAEKEIKL